MSELAAAVRFLAAYLDEQIRRADALKIAVPANVISAQRALDRWTTYLERLVQ